MRNQQIKSRAILCQLPFFLTNELASRTIALTTRGKWFALRNEGQKGTAAIPFSLLK
jgi:hypothetical protein